MLGLIERVVTEPAALGPADVDRVRAAGVDDDAIEDALHVAALFVIFNKLADALGWAMLEQRVFDRRAELALERGYAVPDELLG